MNALIGALGGVGVLLVILLIVVVLAMIWLPLLMVRSLLGEHTAATGTPRNIPMPPSAFEAKHLGGFGGYKKAARFRVGFGILRVGSDTMDTAGVQPAKDGSIPPRRSLHSCYSTGKSG